MPYLQATGALPAEPTVEQLALLDLAAPLVQERSNLLTDAAAMLDFLFTTDFQVNPAAAQKVLDGSAVPILEATVSAVAGLPEFEPGAVEAALKAALVDGLGLKPRLAFAAVRVAVTGSTVSPPLYESMTLLGREVCLARLDSALQIARATS